MRVALISHNARFGDAIGNLVADKLELFLERGADVRVLLESMDGLHPRLKSHTEQIRAEAASPGWDFLVDADLLCVEFGQWYELLGLLPLLTPGKPRILLDYHSITPPEFAGTNHREALIRGRQYRGLAWAADRTIVHSRFTHRELVQATAIPKERLCQLGFPIDLERLRPGAAGDWKRRLGLEHARVLLFVGRLAPNKRVPVLIEALSRLRDLDPPVHAVIVGDTADIYQEETTRCRELARTLGIEDRLHFLGHVGDDDLAEAYRGADVFVIPSLWEGFCIPVLEAMASGLPVVAARAGALPETVADAGLTLRPDDPEDLARQVRRILAGSQIPNLQSVICTLQSEPASLTTHRSPKRVAIVSMRYGDDFAGGAEWSLRRIGTALHRAGNQVEVFTTCTRSENDWSNELPAGTTAGDIPIHRFRLEAHDRRRHLDSVQAIHECAGNVPAEIERAYLEHSLHSPELIEALRDRHNEFDAVIAGPYLFRLTWEVARAFPDKTLLLPCFHDEPLAHLAAWPESYEGVAGILYHSKEEQELAQTDLGLNHPHAMVIGTWLGSPLTTHHSPLTTHYPPDRYLVYCGRYSRQKELPTLLDYARRYSGERPGRFTFAFMGQGEVPIPGEKWARDLGFVGDQEKNRVLAGADALVQLSHFESLSLVALEAWAMGTPVIASYACPVLAGHIERSGGGQTVADYETFAAVLDDLWEQPAAWHTRGEHGQEYVRIHYNSLEGFQKRLAEALVDMAVPLGEQMRLQGLKRAAGFSPAVWREQFSALVEQVLHGTPLPHRDQVEIKPYKNEIKVASNTDLLIAVRLTNLGTHPLLPEGPGRTLLACQIHDAQSLTPLGPVVETPLPAILAPGQSSPAAVSLRAPENPGQYRIALWAKHPNSGVQSAICNLQSAISLVVHDSPAARINSFCAPLLESVQSLLAEAHRRQRLPDDYVDVTEGFLSRCKRWLKQKLLNNFKRAYVDVLSRQQSQVNQQLISAVQELAECCSTLDHAVRVLQERLAGQESEVR
ncbi:MAG TPA: glycosyltransferase family 4 protein, partial [Gemmataceae bacterium]|nr:glycosyltransferase family 4 protein [Gemmataceae bacterium]